MGVLSSIDRYPKKKAREAWNSPLSKWVKVSVGALAVLTFAEAYDNADGDTKLTAEYFGADVSDKIAGGAREAAPVVGQAAVTGFSIGQGLVSGVGEGVDISVSGPSFEAGGSASASGGTYEVQPNDGWLTVLMEGYGMSREAASECISTQNMPMLHPGDKPGNPC